MKRHIAILSLLAVFLFTVPAAAQRQARTCNDPVMTAQAEDIKQHFIKQGFEVMNEATFQMESMAPVPIVAQLFRGQLYVVVFVGHKDAVKVRVDMLDGNQNKFDEKLAMENRDQPRFLAYTFVPDHSDNYMFTLWQKMKGKAPCGTFAILKLAKTDRQVAIMPYTGPQQP